MTHWLNIREKVACGRHVEIQVQIFFCFKSGEKAELGQLLLPPPDSHKQLTGWSRRPPAMLVKQPAHVKVRHARWSTMSKWVWTLTSPLQGLVVLLARYHNQTRQAWPFLSRVWKEISEHTTQNTPGCQEIEQVKLVAMAGFMAGWQLFPSQKREVSNTVRTHVQFSQIYRF